MIQYFLGFFSGLSLAGTAAFFYLLVSPAVTRTDLEELRSELKHEVATLRVVSELARDAAQEAQKTAAVAKETITLTTKPVVEGEPPSEDHYPQAVPLEEANQGEPLNSEKDE